MRAYPNSYPRAQRLNKTVRSEGKQKPRMDLWLISSFASIDRRFHIVMLLFKVQDQKFQEADELVALWIFRKLIILRNGNIFKPSGSAHSLVSMCTDACICFFQRQKCSYCVLKYTSLCKKKQNTLVKVLIQPLYSSKSKKAQLLKCTSIKSENVFWVFFTINKTIHCW